MQQTKLSNENVVNEKVANEIAHTETLGGDDVLQPKDVLQDAAARGQALTGYETLTPWETAKKFKWCTFYVFIAAVAAGTDGYQIGSAFPASASRSLHAFSLTTCC